MLARIKSSQPEGSQHFPVIWLLLERTGNSWMEERGVGGKLSAALRVFSSPSVDLNALSRSFLSRFRGVQVHGRTCPPTPVTPSTFLLYSSRLPLEKKYKLSTRLLLTPRLTSARRCRGRLEQTHASRRACLRDIIISATSKHRRHAAAAFASTPMCARLRCALLGVCVRAHICCGLTPTHC